MFKQGISFLLFLFFVVSCAGTAPLKEYSLARAALKAAKKFEGSQYQPEDYRRAHLFYRKGARSFENRLYREAKFFFTEAIEAAEQAENKTRWDKYQKGDYSL